MILLTGGAGFIGSNILADLNAAGVTEVVVVDRLRHGTKWRNIAKRRFTDLIFPEEVERFLERYGHSISAVVHMGANSSTTARDADDILRTNLRASMRLWEWCTRTQRPLVYASSAATYGDGQGGFFDDDSDEALDRLRPLNLYGWSKHAFDRWAVERARRGEAPPHWAGCKFFNVYGPNEGHKGEMMSLVTKAHAAAAVGKPVRLFRSERLGFADGEQLRDFVYVQDCSAAVLWLLKRGGGIFNLGTGRGRTFREVIQALGSALGREITIEYIDMPSIIREQYQYSTEAAMTKLRGAGYSTPFHSLEEGVRDYVRRFLAMADPYR
jgi:ADP-L-glycero-D-manno-heptose 6-epimerase